jgi:hypothetical protein
VKNKEKVRKIMGFLFPCYYQLYAYSRIRNLNLPFFQWIPIILNSTNSGFRSVRRNFDFRKFFFYLLFFHSHWIFPNFKLNSLLNIFFFFSRPQRETIKI